MKERGRGSRRRQRRQADPDLGEVAGPSYPSCHRWLQLGAELTVLPPAPQFPSGREETTAIAVTSDCSEKWDLRCLPKVWWRGYGAEDRRQGLGQFQGKGEANAGCWKHVVRGLEFVEEPIPVLGR